MVTNPKPNEIYISRIYEAPVEIVWDAWTDPAKVAQWWGPRGFTLTNHSKDLRPGGLWIYTMHGPDGTDYPNRTLYHEVEPLKKLVYDHGATEDRPALFRVTVLFEEVDGKTQMEMTMALPTAEEAEQTRKMIKEKGGNATWDRLAEFVGEATQSRHLFVINRSFNAPPETLCSMWTNQDHLTKWLPPAGFDMEILEGEIAPGKSIFFRTTNHFDVTLHARFAYQEIDTPNRLLYVQRFCDEKGRPGRHPSLPVWPEALLVTVQFTPEGPGASRMTVTCEPHGSATVAEVKEFLAMRKSMTMGWSGSFDKLEASVTKT